MKYNSCIRFAINHSFARVSMLLYIDRVYPAFKARHLPREQLSFGVYILTNQIIEPYSHVDDDQQLISYLLKNA